MTADTECVSPSAAVIASMKRCPRFDGCSAAICPCDPQWFKRVHIRGDSVCRYLMEYAKNGGEARLMCYATNEVFDHVASGYPAIISRWGDIARRLKRASQNGSRLGRRVPRREPV